MSDADKIRNLEDLIIELFETKKMSELIYKCKDESIIYVRKFRGDVKVHYAS